MTFSVLVGSGRRVLYSGVSSVRVDRDGNLRLYRPGKFSRQHQDIFHPAKEWVSLEVVR